MVSTTPQEGPAAGPDAPTPAGPDAAAHFRETFGEELDQVLDVATWPLGGDLAAEYPRIERVVREALAQEEENEKRIRRDIFPKLARADGSDRGVYAAAMDVLRLVHRGLLFNGGVEACDGALQAHDTVPLTIYQVGVALVSYAGTHGTWHQRLYRRDLRERGGDPVEEALRLLERRAARRHAAADRYADGDPAGALVQKALLDYGERAILLDRSQAVWRMGHGNPITYELLTGADLLELMLAATAVMRRLVEHRKFVFVASEPRDHVLLTIGQALPPLHYALVGTLAERLEGWFRQRRFTLESTSDLLWDGEPLAPSEWIPRFIERVASRVVVGLYRATPLAPAQLFYAHADHAHAAAHVVLADSMFQDQRGFPLLLDLARHVCASVFAGSLQSLTETAYAAAGAPWRYFNG